jgi:hypothetical protein
MKLPSSAPPSPVAIARRAILPAQELRLNRVGEHCSMIPKSAHLFSERIMLPDRDLKKAIRH